MRSVPLTTVPAGASFACSSIALSADEIPVGAATAASAAKMACEEPSKETLIFDIDALTRRLFSRLRVIIFSP